MLVELEGGAAVPSVRESVVRKYTWGLDLAGLTSQYEPGAPATGHAGLGGSALQGAGGIGGLLAMQQPPQIRSDLNCVYLYDANGNVGQLAEWSHDPNDPAGALVATYEYDPYGGVTAQSGTYAAANPVRFSTKYWDDETGLGYWGYRYYSPALGRWVSRDPIEEEGGAHLYSYVWNAPSNRTDPYGLCAAHTSCNAAQGTIIADRCEDVLAALNTMITRVDEARRDSTLSMFSRLRLATAAGILRSARNKHGSVIVRCSDTGLCRSSTTIAWAVWLGREVTLCPGYWGLGAVGRTGALLHEMTHLAGATDGLSTYFENTAPHDVLFIGWEFIADTYRYWHDCGFCVPGTTQYRCSGGCPIR